jgi:hypothetical protein
MKFINKILAVVIFTYVVIPATALGAIAVDGITAETVGIPAEDFVTPEEAKEIAVKFFNKFGGADTDASTEQVIFLPWLIEDWNKYEPEVFMGYYEITVYNGNKRFDTYQELNNIVKNYVASYLGDVKMVGGELRYPNELLSREDLTAELFINGEVTTCWVPVNRVYPAVVNGGFDSVIGYGFLTPEIGRQILKVLFGFREPKYLKTAWFGQNNRFDIFQVYGKDFYLQFGDKENKMRYFQNVGEFRTYFYKERSEGDIEEMRNREKWDPFDRHEEDSLINHDDLYDVPTSDSHLANYVPEMTGGVYTIEGQPVTICCGLSAMANIIAFWCGGGYLRSA